MYVGVPQVSLRDRVAAVYNKVGTAKNGERLEVLDRQKRFVKVRTARGEEGWVEQRYLITEDVFKQFDKLAQDSQNLKPISKGVARSELNMHITPARDAEALYRLTEGEKVDVLKRATTERPPKPDTVTKTSIDPKTGKPLSEPDDQPQKVYDDWWLVRTEQGKSGWVLGRMIDIDIPLEVAQYAEGQRIQAAVVLNYLQDGDKRVPQYLVLLTEPRDGMPYDFNQARVFTWNLKKHRYETAYRERNFMGFFPVTSGTENFDKEGSLPTFTLRMQGENGKIIERKYKLNQPMVRRVINPGEEQVKPALASKVEPKKPVRKRK